MLRDSGGMSNNSSVNNDAARSSSSDGVGTLEEGAMDDTSSPAFVCADARMAAVAPHAAQSPEPSMVFSPDVWGTDAAALLISTSWSSDTSPSFDRIPVAISLDGDKSLRTLVLRSS